jgi:hypothetical protein
MLCVNCRRDSISYADRQVTQTALPPTKLKSHEMQRSKYSGRHVSEGEGQHPQWPGVVLDKAGEADLPPNRPGPDELEAARP